MTVHPSFLVAKLQTEKMIKKIALASKGQKQPSNWPSGPARHVALNESAILSSEEDKHLFIKPNDRMACVLEGPV